MDSIQLRDITFPSRDDALRQDVRLLGSLVGEVIREQGGDALFERVESARHASIRRREGMSGADDELCRALRDLDAGTAAEVVRAFSTYFQVVNLAERVHRIRRGRDRLRDQDVPRPGSLAATVSELEALGVDRPRILSLFAESRVEPVFTAHPTESTRRTILEKQERIAAELIARLDPSRTPHDERASLALIRENVTASWQTEENPTEKPTVADEREHVLYYVTHVLYQVLPALHERLDDALHAAGFEEIPDFPTVLRAGSWVGGDMDGNPNVDAATVLDSLKYHRDLAVQAYMGEVAQLARNLSQSASRVAWSEEVAELSARYAALLPEVAAAIPSRHSSMAYRVLLELMRSRLQATAADSELGYGGPDELLADVDTIAESLIEHRGRFAGLFRVQRLRRRIRAFGFHLAALDVRQDARELRDVVGDILQDPHWPDTPASERSARLRALLAGDASGATLRTDGLAASRTLEVFRAIAQGRARYGPDAVGSYIISMAQDVDDVLTVLWLAKLAGLSAPEGIPLDVAPLFETVDDLDRAESVLDALFSDPVVSPHLSRRDKRQLVMVGYSDSNKDGGVASARWALQRALEGMSRSAKRHGVTLTVFHGRGGTVSRGGGSIQRAVAAMPAASIGGRLRLTEQGEVIDAKYGLPAIAIRNLEGMLGSIVLRSAQTEERPLPPRLAALAETVSSVARQTYRSLVYDDPRFQPYFRNGTPIDVIERMSIGSRPASRRTGAGVEDLRAIPWVFSWTQCRAILTGWYGLGAGLAAARREHGLGLLQEAAASWPFFDALLADVEMVLAKADLGIAGMYMPLAPQDSRGVFDEIRAEFDRTASAMLEIRRTSNLLDAEPTLQRSIRLRNPYVDPMNILQVDLLERWRGEGRPEGELFHALLATVNGIARGLQNTG